VDRGCRGQPAGHSRGLDSDLRRAQIQHWARITSDKAMLSQLSKRVIRTWVIR